MTLHPLNMANACIPYVVVYLLQIPDDDLKSDLARLTR